MQCECGNSKIHASGYCQSCYARKKYEEKALLKNKPMPKKCFCNMGKKCYVIDCENKATKRGLCNKHYTKQYDIEKRGKITKECIVCKSRLILSIGLCLEHFTEYKNRKVEEASISNTEPMKYVYTSSKRCQNNCGKLPSADCRGFCEKCYEEFSKTKKNNGDHWNWKALLACILMKLPPDNTPNTGYVLREFNLNEKEKKIDSNTNYMRNKMKTRLSAMKQREKNKKEKENRSNEIEKNDN